MKTVLVTGIGGNVGQGIIRNIRSLKCNIKIVGTNIKHFSAGNHLCDIFYKIPYAYEASYIYEIRKIVEKEKVDLIIPSTDFEAYYLSMESGTLPSKIAVSSLETIQIYFDKFKTAIFHEQKNIPFAKTFLPSKYQGIFNEIIVKPRFGGGSKGIILNPSDFNKYLDKNYIIQEFYNGIEITTAFYVNKKKNLHGFINFTRELENGMTIETKVERKFDTELEKILNQIVRHSDIKGSANMQSIVLADGQIIPFEINCRISGTNSIRANFGFQDVKYTLQEYLFDEKPDMPLIKNGIAVRIFMDVIYLNAKTKEECSNSSVEHFLF